MKNKPLKKLPAGINKPRISRRGAGTRKLQTSLLHPLETERFVRRPVQRQLPRRQVKYPWSEWMDGSTWLIKQGEDFTITTENMIKSLHVRAWRHGYFVEAGGWEDGLHVVFRFYTGRKQVRRLRSQFHSDI